MPIYEFFCPNNNKIYQFYAKTLAQGQRVPKCPDNPKFRMEKIVSRFAVNTGGNKAESDSNAAAGQGDGRADSPAGEDPRMDAAMGEMEREFASVDENDPRAMGRMMRRMAEMSGEKLEGEMEEVVRKLEEGTDPETLEEKMGGGEGDEEGGEDFEGGAAPADKASEGKEARARYRARRLPPVRDPKLYDFE